MSSTHTSIFEIPVPGELTGEGWHDRLVAYERQGRTVADVLAIAEHLEVKHSTDGRAAAVRRSKRLHLDRQVESQATSGKPVLMPLKTTSRKGHIDAGHEDEYLIRAPSEAPRLRLVDIGDRLAIWSPVKGGGMTNPKGTGLHRFGLITTFARGTGHHGPAFKAADLGKGRPVEIVRDSDNPYDGHAVALRSPRASTAFGFVQQGRSAGVARRIDSGEELVGVCLWGPSACRDDESCLVLIGTAADIEAMTAELPR